MMQRSNTRKSSERDESLIRYFGEISEIPLLWACPYHRVVLKLSLVLIRLKNERSAVDPYWLPCDWR